MKKIILVYIIGLLMGVSITVIASYAFNASDIDFTPSDSSWSVSNVSDAIKDLKNTEDNIVKLDIGDTYVTTYEGDLLASNNLNVNITKGKYIVYTGIVYGNARGDLQNFALQDQSYDYLILTCSNCDISQKKQLTTMATSSIVVVSNYYLYNQSGYKIYYVDAKEDTTLNLSQTWDSTYYVGTSVFIMATKIAD